MKSNLKFPIADLSGPVIEAYPTLAAYKEFTEADDRLMRYVIWGYDKGSELMAHKQPVKRREEALLKAGFTRSKNGKWDDARAEAILANRDKQVNAMIIRWLRSVMHSREFAFWVNGNEMIWQNIEKIAQPIEGEDVPDIEEVMGVAEAKKAMQKGNEKEKDIQSAYTTRNNIYKELPGQMERLDEMEKKIFPDTDTRDMAADEASSLNAGLMEEWANENGKKKPK